MKKSLLRRKYAILLILTSTVMSLDQATKAMIVSRFRLNEILPVIGGVFNITYVRNTGAAFGILQNANPVFRVPFFIIVPLVALIAIAMIFKKIADADAKLSVALSLVIGGALGNLVDRLRFGFVVDFLDFHWRVYHFPSFNVADSSICIGVGILMLDLLAQERDDKETHASTSI